MKILIITQTVDKDDPILGFFIDWIEEFAKQCEKVMVICLCKGEYNLPGNVEVLSLGKEKFPPKADQPLAEKIKNASQNQKIIILPPKIKYTSRFFKYIWGYRKEYDAVFVHMNPEYAALGGILWKIMDKKIGLWFTHKSVTVWLRIAEKLVDAVFTASEESFRLPSDKIKVLGHGIDINKFSILDFRFSNEQIFKLISIGRISPVKDYEVMIEAVGILVKNGMDDLRLEIIGGPGLEEHIAYLEKLHELVRAGQLDGKVLFRGPMTHDDALRALANADLFLHASRTGSLDKAMLEAMAAGIPVITSNEAGRELLKKSGFDMCFTEGDAEDLARKIEGIRRMGHGLKEGICKSFKRAVAENHGLGNLVDRIIGYLSQSR